MHKITKIDVIGTDKKTGSIVKEVHTTADDVPFYNKTCAYNQTYQRFEKTMVAYGGKRFEAIPLTISTRRYLTKDYDKCSLLKIKDLTKSRLNNGGLFYREIQSIKKEALTNQNAVVFYFQVPLEDWEHYTFEDLKTLVLLLIKAGVPHITIPTHPLKTFVENREFFENIKKKLSKEQTIIAQFHPDMKNREGEQMLQKFFMEDNCIMTLFTGLSPNAKHLSFYSYCWYHHPKGKLLCAADVQDTFGKKEQKLSTHLALRRFGFDITCRRITYPLGRDFGFPTPPEENFIYDDNTAGMLAESDQESWHGVSAVDIVMENFPANTGLSFREYVLAYNFTQLNRTGFKEADFILKNKHTVYITARPYLQAYWST